MDTNKQFADVKRHEFAHGQNRAMNPGRMETYGPTAFRGYSHRPDMHNEYEENAGYRTRYDRLGESIERQQGTHRGKGPRIYKRNDARILEEINEHMCDNPYLDATEIEVEVKNGEVILSGTVDNKESKRLAEEIGEEIRGASSVVNRLKVQVMGV